MLAPRLAASRICATADCEIGLGIGSHPHLHQAYVIFASVFHFDCMSFVAFKDAALTMARPTPSGGIGLNFNRDRSRYSSRISTAAAIVVVQSPRLSPTADCVTLLVRTILLEMR